jgi:hypothetical protein
MRVVLCCAAHLCLASCAALRLCCGVLWCAVVALQVTLEPDSNEAAELRNWWSSEGSSSDITPLGQVCVGESGMVCFSMVPVGVGALCVDLNCA